ncbi:hypothetical protein CEXT_327181 [Caerostris extrusa]|uniref:Uncharacterized protein n=1 Tax=Caerostris extrusa TaxID=172846 RepID=A0AAV4XST5_CAEEX|nr:hypothetical protein CEXT_327181 [Caerostris extrusa]
MGNSLRNDNRLRISERPTNSYQITEGTRSPQGYVHKVSGLPAPLGTVIPDASSVRSHLSPPFQTRWINVTLSGTNVSITSLGTSQKVNILTQTQGLSSTIKMPFFTKRHKYQNDVWLRFPLQSLVTRASGSNPGGGMDVCEGFGIHVKL